MPLPKEKITMKTIAEEAGVTLTTVSRILNNKGGKYAEPTREKIFSIARRLKYRPNALVHGMQTGRTDTAGVMVPASSPFYSQVVGGIHEEFLEHDTIMLLSWNFLSAHAREEGHERHIMYQMVDRRVDGVILRPSSEDFERSYFEEIWERDIPLILIDRNMSKIDTDFVGTDDRLGGQAAAEHLLSLGHRKMLFLGASHEVSTSRHREEGFRKVLSETPDAFCHSLTIEEDPSWEEMIRMVKAENAPTAIFCYTDGIARPAATTLLQEGFSIPGDISLLGFGNTPTTDPSIALTTFDQHPQEIGRMAARMYLHRVNSSEPNSFRTELVKPELLVRNSTRSIT